MHDSRESLETNADVCLRSEAVMQAYTARQTRPGGVVSQVRRRRFLIAAANALRVAIPQSVLVRADEVIE